MDCSLLGFSIHGILQARILEWVTISFSRGSSQPRDRTWVSCIGGRRFNLWATREAHGLSRKEANLMKFYHHQLQGKLASAQLVHDGSQIQKCSGSKQISYTNANIRNLEKWYWWTYLQGRNKSIGSRLVNTVGWVEAEKRGRDELRG